MQDIILIDKPSGITSFDVIRSLRKKLGIRKMGHAGTLDPLATGLLIVGIGPGTKKLSSLIGLPKEYIAEIELGIKTDTADRDGNVIETKPVPNLTDSEIRKVLQNLEGEILLPVPAYSAVKQGGERLYARARKGESVTPPQRTMEVREAEFMTYKDNLLTARFQVGSGTYIRSLAERIGEDLQTLGTIKNLRRTSIGSYRIEDATALSAISSDPEKTAPRAS